MQQKIVKNGKTKEERCSRKLNIRKMKNIRKERQRRKQRGMKEWARGRQQIIKERKKRKTERRKMRD